MTGGQRQQGHETLFDAHNQDLITNERLAAEAITSWQPADLKKSWAVLGRAALQDRRFALRLRTKAGVTDPWHENLLQSDMTESIVQAFAVANGVGVHA